MKIRRPSLRSPASLVLDTSSVNICKYTIHRSVLFRENLHFKFKCNPQINAAYFFPHVQLQNTYNIVPFPNENCPRILCTDRLTGQGYIVLLQSHPGLGMSGNVWLQEITIYR